MSDERGRRHKKRNVRSNSSSYAAHLHIPPKDFPFPQGDDCQLSIPVRHRRKIPLKGYVRAVGIGAVVRGDEERFGPEPSTYRADLDLDTAIVNIRFTDRPLREVFFDVDKWELVEWVRSRRLDRRKFDTRDLSILAVRAIFPDERGGSGGANLSGKRDESVRRQGRTFEL